MNPFTAFYHAVQMLHSWPVSVPEGRYSALVTHLWLQAWRRITSGTCPGWFALTCYTEHSASCRHRSASSGDVVHHYLLAFLVSHIYILQSPLYSHLCADTRCFKYGRDYLCVNKSQFVPVIFEPPCTSASLHTKYDEIGRKSQTAARAAVLVLCCGGKGSFLMLLYDFQEVKISLCCCQCFSSRLCLSCVLDFAWVIFPWCNKVYRYF
jgi:hypothetical protein